MATSTDELVNVITNIFMAKLESDVVRPFNLPFYDRYVDDCFSKRRKVARCSA